MNDTLYIVIPCYNEEEVLHETVKRLTAKFDKMIEENSISENSRIMLVNDGSKDSTPDIALEYQNMYPDTFRLINKENGGIYETYDSSCNDEAMSFFFPLSFDSNEKVRFQIVYYDVGYNHNDYIFEGYIFSKVITNDDFGGLLSYKYQEIQETLEVEYE